MTKIQCKNINVNIFYDIQANILQWKLFAWVRIVKEDDVTCFSWLPRGDTQRQAHNKLYSLTSILHFPC